jgi:hypothetical protein
MKVGMERKLKEEEEMKKKAELHDTNNCIGLIKKSI